MQIKFYFSTVTRKYVSSNGKFTSLTLFITQRMPFVLVWILTVCLCNAEMRMLSYAERTDSCNHPYHCSRTWLVTCILYNAWICSTFSKMKKGNVAKEITDTIFSLSGKANLQQINIWEDTILFQIYELYCKSAYFSHLSAFMIFT